MIVHRSRIRQHIHIRKNIYMYMHHLWYLRVQYLRCMIFDEGYIALRTAVLSNSGGNTLPIEDTDRLCGNVSVNCSHNRYFLLLRTVAS